MENTIRKLILALTILGSVLTVIGQKDAEDCPVLKIDAPSGRLPWNEFKASLDLTEKQRAEIRDVRWTITKHNTALDTKEVETIRDALSVEVKAWNANQAGYITYLVVARLGECISAGVETSVVTPNPGTPYVIDEFSRLRHIDERGRLDAALADMEERKDFELIIFAYFAPRTTWKERRLRVKRILDHLIGYRRFDSSRVTLAISEGPDIRFRLQPVPRNSVSIYASLGDLVIPAERFDDFERFFK